MNHCTKVADRIKKGNEAVRSGLQGAEAPRDQGFTRPKVLDAIICYQQDIIRALVSYAEGAVHWIHFRTGPISAGNLFCIKWMTTNLKTV